MNTDGEWIRVENMRVTILTKIWILPFLTEDEAIAFHLHNRNST